MCFSGLVYIFLFFEEAVDHLDLPVQTHSVPTRCASELTVAPVVVATSRPIMIMRHLRRHTDAGCRRAPYLSRGSVCMCDFRPSGPCIASRQVGNIQPRLQTDTAGCPASVGLARAAT